eukprot:CAMPEP_0170545320 /NCGR_PEP_ID=MMETSP0211-20121228/3740_1 /TAXON_ID=311385 /ORGANISM="Pseudokeronopsis sp., Strain OXSARD2" /LENGTH=197 /DNA_ID=CAMNT_0010849181 /DNA_START=855 /DNA_END=1448 /DNA_ORIENTATION=-
MMVKIQHIVGYMYIPLFKLMLYIAAPLFAIFSPRSKNGTFKELFLMAMYYTWFFYFLSYLPTMQHRLVYFLVNNIFTSIVFVQIVLAHLAMPTPDFPDDMEFFRHQILTTLDVSCNPWWDWFHGGLNFQIPHHIWPRIARPHLRRTQELLAAFCKKHSIDYKIVTLPECLRMIITQIASVAHQVDAHDKLKEGKKAQ